MAVQALERAEESLSDAVLKAAFEHGTSQAVALAIVNSVKRKCGCRRVSLAIVGGNSAGGQPELIAMSDQARVDTRKVLPSLVVAVMREALLATMPLFINAGNVDKRRVDFPSAGSLFSEQGQYPSLVVAFPDKRLNAVANLTAVSQRMTQVLILLERPAGQPFNAAQIKAIQSLLGPSADLLARLCDEQRPVRAKLMQSARRRFDPGNLLKPEFRHRWALVLTVLTLASLLVPVNFRISARAVIEARDLQVMSAPQNGFVATSHVRAGDTVEEEQLLATLDARDLELALGKWNSERVKNTQAMQQALATRDRVAIGRLRADAQRISAEHALVERQLERSRLHAPFKGVVLSGDLSQKLGSAVTQGDTLFTVASSNENRLVLDIEERDVGLVKAGQEAYVRMSAMPDQVWQASIETVLPVATTREDRHVFRVPAILSRNSEELLPGMEGIARVQVGRRAAAWVFTRSLREKVRLLFWRFGLLD